MLFSPSLTKLCLQHANSKQEEIDAALSSFNVTDESLEAGNESLAGLKSHQSEPSERPLRNRLQEALEEGVADPSNPSHPSSGAENDNDSQQAGKFGTLGGLLSQCVLGWTPMQKLIISHQCLQ